MEKKKSNTSTYKILLRLDHETNQILETYGKSIGINKTQLIRNSLSNLIFSNFGNPTYFNPKSIFSQNMLHFLFNKCSENELKQLAQLSFDNSMIEFQNTDFPLKSQLILSDPTLIMDLIVKYIFSPLGHSWFDKCELIKRGNNITIFGSHNLGPNFHIFVRHLLCLYFNLFRFEMLKDRPTIEELQEQAKEFNMKYVKREYYKFSITFAPKSRVTNVKEKKGIKSGETQ